jgi:hypothetical protein
MKKIFFILTAICIFSFSSCDFINVTNKSSDASAITAPAIESKSDGLVVSPSYLAGTVYLNIIRYEVNGSTDSATIVENTTQNIGQVTVATINNSLYTGSILFTDYYTDPSKYYQYFIRYKTSTEYKTSAVSGTYQGAGTAGVKAITNNTSNEAIQIVLNTSQYILSFTSTDIGIPTPYDTTDSFDLMIGLNNGTNTLLFPMTLDSANNKYTLSLRNVLPDTFIATPLTMKCIIGQTDATVQKGSNDTTTIYTVYHWTTSLSAAAVVNSAVVDNFTIPKDVDKTTTIDFTPTANKRSSLNSEVLIYPVFE